MTEIAHDTKSKSKTQKPQQYTVVFKNDDFTPVEFVVKVLIQFFNLDPVEAEKVTMSIHKSGHGNAGTYTLEVAQMKVAQVMSVARNHEYPLTCTPEPL